MKLCSLIFTKLLSFIRQNPFLFSFICVSLAACDLMFLYVLGVSRADALYSSGVPMYRYDIEAVGGELLSCSDMTDAVSSVMGDVEIDTYAPIDTASTFYAGGEINGALYSIRATNRIEDHHVVRGNLDDLSDPDAIVVPEALTGVRMGDEVTVNGVKFTVVGTVPADWFLLPDRSLIGTGFPVAAASVPTDDEHGERGARLREAVGEGYSVSFRISYAQRISSRNDTFAILALYAICSLSFLFFCTYLYEDSAYEFNVFRILGARRFHVVAVMLGMVGAIVTAVFWLTAAVHRLLYDSVFGILITEPYRYTFADYGQIWLGSTAVISGFLCVWLILKSRKSMIVNTRNMIR